MAVIADTGAFSKMLQRVSAHGHLVSLKVLRGKATMWSQGQHTGMVARVPVEASAEDWSCVIADVSTVCSVLQMGGEGKIEKSSGSVTVSCNGSRFVSKVAEVTQPIPKFSGFSWAEDSKSLIKAIRGVAWAANVDDVRPLLSTVHIGKDGFVEATNGYVYACSSSKVTDGGFDLLIDIAMINSIDTGDVEMIGFSENQVAVRGSNWAIIGSLVSGSYPDTLNGFGIRDLGDSGCLEIDNGHLRSILHMHSHTKNAGVRFNFLSGDVVTVSGGGLTSELTSTKRGQDYEFFLDKSFEVQMLKQALVSSKAQEMFFNDIGAVYFPGEEYSALVMARRDM